MENFYEKIEDYLLGDLPESERAAFEAALAADPELARAVARQEAMTQHLNALRLRNKVKSALREPAEERAKRLPMVYSPTLWAMAASLVLLAAAIWFFVPSSPADPAPMADQPAPTAPPPALPSPSPVPVPPPPVASKPSRLLALAKANHIAPDQSMIRDAVGQASTTQTPSQLAAEAYRLGAYRRVIGLLRAEEVLKSDDAARFLRANAYFQLQQFREAARDFEVLHDSFQFRHEARWNAVLCQIALGEVAQARARLRQMAADANFPFREKAAELGKKV